MSAGGPPLVVTGMPRSGTSWVGKMLELGGEVVYLNEPMNPAHPPGRSPGVLDAEVRHYFHYISAGDDLRWRQAFHRAAALRYGIGPELRRNRSGYDLARAVKYWSEFTRGRLTGRRALLDDPYALPSAGWLAEQLGAVVVVLVRDPVSLASSWQRLGWSLDPRELLDQPALVADHLRADQALLEAAVDADPVEQLAAVWRALHTVVLATAGHPRVLLRRYEDLAADPVTGFAALYADCRLTWSDRVAEGIRTATSAGTGNRAGAFRWSLRSGLSRTAYRPMDSAHALRQPAAGGLGPGATARVRELTGDVLGRLSAYLPEPVPGRVAGRT